MPSRITRRTLVGWLVRSASAAAAIGLLRTAPEAAGVDRVARAAELTAAAEPAPANAVPAARTTAGPVPVRMADLVLEGRQLRTGHAEGVRLPSQGGDAAGLAAERAGGVYTSAPMQAEFPCTNVGVHWRTDGGDQRGIGLALRASRDGQAWMPWRHVRPESHGPDRVASPADAETFGALVSVRLGQWFQVRVTFDEAGPELASIHALTLTCLDGRRPPEAAHTPVQPQEKQHPTSILPLSRVRPGWPTGLGGEGLPTRVRPGWPTGARDAGLPASSVHEDALLRAGLTGFLDRVVSREAWGADESLRFKDGKDVWPTAFVAPSLLVVHHTAGDGEIVDAEAEVRAIYAYHAVTQGWGDIGYHLLIDSSGRVYEGRRGREPDPAGRREIVSENVVAGHALDYNYGSVGIALLGNYQLRQPSPVTIDALVEALAFMAQRYRIDPTATMSYPRARSDGTALWRDGLSAISGHRDCIPTECPGENVYPLLPSISQRVEGLLGNQGPAARITHGPADRNLWPGDLVFAWEPAEQAGPEAVEVSTRLAGWIRAPGTDKIATFSGYTDDEQPVWEPWTRNRTVSVPLPPDGRGIYTLFVRARDAAGHEGRVSARWHLAVDRHVVVDDTDALRTRHEGAWERSHRVLGYDGAGYQEAAPGQPAAVFHWQLAVPEDGTYQLQASWTDAPDRTTGAVYRLSQGGNTLGGESVSQQESGGRWVGLLAAPLEAGVPCVVELDGAADGVTVADAVRLVQLD